MTEKELKRITRRQNNLSWVGGGGGGSSKYTNLAG